MLVNESDTLAEDVASAYGWDSPMRVDLCSLDTDATDVEALLRAKGEFDREHPGFDWFADVLNLKTQRHDGDFEEVHVLLLYSPSMKYLALGKMPSEDSDAATVLTFADVVNDTLRRCLAYVTVVPAAIAGYLAELEERSFSFLLGQSRLHAATFMRECLAKGCVNFADRTLDGSSRLLGIEGDVLHALKSAGPEPLLDNPDYLSGIAHYLNFQKTHTYLKIGGKRRTATAEQAMRDLVESCFKSDVLPALTLRLTLTDPRGDEVPVCWREVKVPADATLGMLHRTIQRAFGWQECHLHSFDYLDKEARRHFDDAFWHLLRREDPGRHPEGWTDSYRDPDAIEKLLQTTGNDIFWLARQYRSDEAKAELAADEIWQAQLVESVGTIGDYLLGHGLCRCIADDPDCVVDIAGTHGLLYNYDFGDDWFVAVEVVGFDACSTGTMPLAIDGKGENIPEDVGGIGGYERFLDALLGKQEDEEEGLIDWAKSNGWHHYAGIVSLRKQLNR